MDSLTTFQEDLTTQLTKALQASNINIDTLLSHLGGKQPPKVKTEPAAQGLSKEKAAMLKVQCLFVPVTHLLVREECNNNTHVLVCAGNCRRKVTIFW
jgi:hypothetical protein